MINQTLAQGMYNRMCRESIAGFNTRLEKWKAMPPGRQRRGPWYRNRVRELRMLFGDSLLYEQASGEGKHRCTDFFLLELVDHHHPLIHVFRVCAKDMRVISGHVPLIISTHAMSRLIQAGRCAELRSIRRYLGDVVPVMFNILLVEDDLSVGQTVMMANRYGLYILTVERGRDHDAIELVLKTFIAESVLDGPNRIEYDWLCSDYCAMGYTVHCGEH